MPYSQSLEFFSLKFQFSTLRLLNYESFSLQIFILSITLTNFLIII